MIDCPLAVMRLTVYLHEHLIEMPFPVPEPAHAIDPLKAHFAGEHWPKPIPPETHRLVTNIDAAFEQEILDVSQRKRKPDINQHDEADNFR